MPNTSPGLFVSWQFESGLRYREMLFIADYELCRRGVWLWASVRVVHESEVHTLLTQSFLGRLRGKMQSTLCDR